MSTVFLWLGIVLGIPGGVLSQEVPDTLDRYLHKNAVLGMGLSPIFPPGEAAALSGRLFISPRTAAAFGVFHLQRMGVGNIVICESRWIAAAISGYLIDALGKCTIEGRQYSVFRIGIRDGQEARHGAEYNAGTQFVFIAMGWDSLGKEIWYPRCGPDFHPSADKNIPPGALNYEFLLHRNEFESLPERFKNPMEDVRSQKHD
jgi:hypothetical protein